MAVGMVAGTAAAAAVMAARMAGRTMVQANFAAGTLQEAAAAGTQEETAAAGTQEEAAAAARQEAAAAAGVAGGWSAVGDARPSSPVASSPAFFSRLLYEIPHQEETCWCGIPPAGPKASPGHPGTSYCMWTARLHGSGSRSGWPWDALRTLLAWHSCGS